MICSRKSYPNMIAYLSGFLSNSQTRSGISSEIEFFSKLIDKSRPDDANVCRGKGARLAVKHSILCGTPGATRTRDTRFRKPVYELTTLAIKFVLDS